MALHWCIILGARYAWLRIVRDECCKLRGAAVPALPAAPGCVLYDVLWEAGSDFCKGGGLDMSQAEGGPLSGMTSICLHLISACHAPPDCLWDEQ